MKIAITVGHSILKNGNCTSAGGYVQEYKYCKELAPLIANYLKQEKHTVDVIVCPERQFNKAYEEKTYKLSKVNRKGYDLLVELHLNAFNGSAKGTEVLYYSDRGKIYAQRVNDKLDDIFTDRNIKKRTDLYILRDTDCPAILVEAFFCDNKEDYQKADEAHEKDLIARKIAEGILNKNLDIQNKKYKNCILYGNDIDKVGAEIISWSKEDCIVKNVKDHIVWEGSNLFTVGGQAKSELDKMNTKEKYTPIIGSDRYDTIRSCLRFIGK